MDQLELELTYLASASFNVASLKSGVDMIDVYLPPDDEVRHPRLRLRKYGNQYSITKKTPVLQSDASAHTEHTIELSVVEFECLRKTSNRIIEKTRYQLKIKDVVADVDVFKGALTGLVLIDFEFDSEGELKAFSPPSECLADVTQEDFIAGGILAGKSYSDIAESLSNYEYKKI